MVIPIDFLAFRTTRIRPTLFAYTCLLAACHGSGDDTGTDAGTDSGTAGTPTDDTGEPTGSTGVPIVDQAIYSECNDFYAQLHEIQEKECECSVAADLYPDVPTCVADSSTIKDGECSCRVYSQLPETKSTLDCYTAATNAMLTCLAGATCAPGDIDDANACFLAYDDMFKTCMLPPGVDDEEKMQCYTLCSSSELIENWKICDGDADCLDGSDEMNCPPSSSG